MCRALAIPFSPCKRFLPSMMPQGNFLPLLGNDNFDSMRRNRHGKRASASSVAPATGSSRRTSSVLVALPAARPRAGAPSQLSRAASARTDTPAHSADPSRTPSPAGRKTAARSAAADSRGSPHAASPASMEAAAQGPAASQEAAQPTEHTAAARPPPSMEGQPAIAVQVVEAMPDATAAAHPSAEMKAPSEGAAQPVRTQSPAEASPQQEPPQHADGLLEGPASAAAAARPEADQATHGGFAGFPESQSSQATTVQHSYKDSSTSDESVLSSFLRQPETVEAVYRAATDVVASSSARGAAQQGGTGSHEALALHDAPSLDTFIQLDAPTASSAPCAEAADTEHTRPKDIQAAPRNPFEVDSLHAGADATEPATPEPEEARPDLAADRAGRAEHSEPDQHEPVTPVAAERLPSVAGGEHGFAAGKGATASPASESGGHEGWPEQALSVTAPSTPEQANAGPAISSPESATPAEAAVTHDAAEARSITAAFSDDAHKQHAAELASSPQRNVDSMMSVRSEGGATEPQKGFGGIPPARPVEHATEPRGAPSAPASSPASRAAPGDEATSSSSMWESSGSGEGDSSADEKHVAMTLR